ncbi:MAG: CRR6 family NdhI maturation factor [Synechococcus sp.]
MDPVLISSDVIKTLDLSPLAPWSDAPLDQTLRTGPVLELQFDWPREPNDPRELAECPEPRLWALRADARLPWLPLILERDNGSLIRHVAMVVPHSFNRSEGLRFDPQALELWITHRMMLLDDLCRTSVGRSMRNNLSQVAASLGYELDHRFWDLLD